MTLAPSPLYSDPVHLAPTDPAVIAGPDGSWWMFYTQRRAREPDGGTDIGVAGSADACAHELPGGGWRLWYKDEAHGSTTWSVDSPDLAEWSAPVQVIGGAPHEGPNVFRLGDFYWMITDEWRGQAVYRSRDLTHWERAGQILDERSIDRGVGHHADVVVGRDENGLEVGWIFYFTHRTAGAVDRVVDPHRLTDIHVAVLRADSDRLSCDRDAPVALDLRRTV